MDLQPVPAEALWVPLVGRRIWMAMALAVASRLWLGGTISPHRALGLITTLVQVVRSCGRHLAMLVCVGELAGMCPGTRCAPAVAGGRGGSWGRGCCWSQWSKGQLDKVKILHQQDLTEGCGEV